MFHYFEDVSDLEIFSWLQPSILPTPCNGFSILAIGLELQQRVIDAVKEHLVVDVLTLRQEVPQQVIFARRLVRGALRCLLLLIFVLLFQLFLSPLLSSPLQGEVQVER